MDYQTKYINELKAMEHDALEESIKKDVEELKKIKVIDFDSADRHTGLSRVLYLKMQVLTIKLNERVNK